MARAYGDASERLIAELAALDDRLAKREAAGEPLADAALAMRDRLEALIGQTQDQLRVLSGDAVDIVSDAQKDALEIANEQTEDLVYAATGDPKEAAVAIRFDRLPTETLEEFIGLSSDGSPLAVLFDEIAQSVPDALRFTLSSGLAQGRNPRAVARDMRTLATLPQRRAETIARTEMLRASREAQRRMYQGSPAVTGYERVATQDARVCLACLALSGTIHATSEIMPSHPNCRCVMVPRTPSLAEITGDPSIPDLRPDPIRSDDIIRGLTKDELVGIMGPKRFAMWEQGTPLINMVGVVQNPKWGPTTKILPLKDVGPGAGPGTTPKPGPAPKPPRKPRTPKPKAPVAPKIEEILKRNRDPQWLLEEFRKIAPDRSKLNEILDGMKPHLEKLAEAKAALAADPDNQKAKKDVAESASVLEAMRKDYQRESKLTSTSEQKAKMRELLRSANPISVSVKDMIDPKTLRDDFREYPLSDKQSQRIRQILGEVTSYIDDRKLDLLVWIQGDEPHLSREERRDSNGEIDAKDVRFVGTKLQDTFGYYVGIKQSTRKHIGLNLELLKDTGESDENRFSIGALPSTVAHEFMHWVDDRNPMRVNAYREFYKRRTTGDPLLPSIYGGEYRPDRWPDAYCGKTDIASRDGNELNTRGLQFILDDPLGFAELDFDYFSYVVKNVLGAQE